MTQESKREWEEYEAITKYIYEALGEREGIKVIGYGRNCKVKGKSGVPHQIDVLTEQLDGDKAYRTAIECKFLKSKVTKKTVMILEGIMKDAEIESGIIVCKRGYTRDTLRYAEHKGIKLVEFREAEENDPDYNKTFEIGTLDINVNAMVSRGTVTSINLGSKIIDNEDEIMAMYYVNLQDIDGRVISFGEFLKAFSEEVQKRAQLLKSTVIDYPLNRMLFWKHPDGEIAIEKISITGFFIKVDQSSKRSFRITDKVWMIMKELFEGRKLTLSKSGVIWNLPSTS